MSKPYYEKRLQFKRKPDRHVGLGGLFSWPIWPGTRARIYGDLASMLRSGISLFEALQTLQESYGGRIRSLFKRLNDRVRAGQGLGKAMMDEDALIPPGDAVLVQASEQVGAVPDALDSLASLYRLQVELLKQHSIMIIYPLLLYMLSLFILNLPALIKSGAAVFLTNVAIGFFYLMIPVVLLGIVIAFVPFRRLFRSFKALAWHLPVVSIPLKHLAVGMYAKGMWAGLNAGFGIDKTLDIAAKLSNFKNIELKNNLIKQKITSGNNLFEAFRAAGIFSTGELTSIRAGEKSGTLDQVFESISSERLSRFRITAKILMYAVLLPFFIGMMGVVGYRIIQQFKAATIGNLDQINRQIMRQAPFKFR